MIPCAADLLEMLLSLFGLLHSFTHLLVTFVVYFSSTSLHQHSPPPLNQLGHLF
jgi:hypothetical protein